MMIDTYYPEYDDEEDCVCMDCGRPISPYECAKRQLCPFCIEREEEYLEELMAELAEQPQTSKV